MNTSPRCQIFQLNGSVNRNSSIAKAFQSVARRQKSYFVDIFPWESQLRNNMIMFVAATDVRNLRCSRTPTQDTNICGWLTAFVQDDGAVYLAEITSRSATDKSERFKGMGYKLFQELVKWCVSNNKRYIYLYPLNETVEEIYVQKWKLTRPKEQSKYLFYQWDLDQGPTLQELETINQNIEVTDFDVIAESMTESQIKWMKQLKTKCPKSFDKIVDEVQQLICACDEPDNATSYISDYFKSMGVVNSNMK